MSDNSNTAQLDAEADAIINWASARAGVIVVAPIVGGTFLVANEVYMIVRLGQVYGQELTTSTAAGFIAGMAGMVGGQLLAGLLPIPGFSTIVGIGTTYAMGHAAKAWIKDGTPADVKRYKEVAARARAEADRISDQLKNDPRRDQPLGDESKKFLASPKAWRGHPAELHAAPWRATRNLSFVYSPPFSRSYPPREACTRPSLPRSPPCSVAQRATK